MMELLPLNHPMLKVPPTEFTAWDEAEDIGEMIFTRQQAIGGVGLSTNQVGLNYRMFTMGIKKDKWIMFNPELVSVSEEQVKMEEGCLSARHYVKVWPLRNAPSHIRTQIKKLSWKNLMVCEAELPCMSMIICWGKTS